MTGKQKLRCFLIYSILFWMLAFFAYRCFFARSFIMDDDAFRQHYRALLYYSEWLKKIVNTFWTQRKLVIPEWDFHIGYGSNILTTLHYYVLGDPLTLLSVFIPENHMMWFYGFLILLRGYLAGISYVCFCIYMQKKNDFAVLAGAVTYVFCAYALSAGTRHPFFVNPMIYFPLILLGVEKVMRENSPCVLIMSVFLSALSNFYYFYMIVLLTVLYVLVRGICKYGRRDKKLFFLQVLRIGLYSLIGVMMSAALILPVVTAFLGDHRRQVEYAVPLFYGLLNYLAFPVAFTSAAGGGYYTILGYGAHGLLAVALLFLGTKRKQYPLELRALFILGTVFLLLPFAGHILNGLSNVSNRWVWGYSFLNAYIVCEVWDAFFTATRKDIVKLAVIGILYMLPSLFYVNGDLRAVYPFLCAILCVVFASHIIGERKRAQKWMQGCVFCLVIAGMLVNGHRLFDEEYLSSFLDAEDAQARYDNEPVELVRELSQSQTGTFRFAGNALGENAALEGGYAGMSYYWSLSNANITDFLIQTETNVFRLNHYRELDERSGLTTLAGNRYYIMNREGMLPYGYELTEEKDGCRVYENIHALPLGYTYDSNITYREAETLNGIQKEETMLQSVILEENVAGLKNGQPQLTGRELSYHISAKDNGVKVKKNAFVVSKRRASVTLAVDSAENAGETYLCVKGFDYAGNSDSSRLLMQAHADGDAFFETELFFANSASQWPTGRSDFSVNLGFSEKPVQEITITFGKKGKYTFDDLSVWHQPLGGYEEYLNERKKDVMVDEQSGVDTLRGRIHLSEEKVLLLTIPYDGGWSVCVDGARSELMKANYMFSALKLPAGEHTIELVYHTPGLKAGLILTAFGLVLFFAVMFCQHKERLY